MVQKNDRVSNWPSHVAYASHQRYHSSVPPTVLNCIQGSGSPEARPHDAHARSLVTIKCITDPSHPAYNQCGLFAVKKITPKTHILDYTGEVHCDERPDSDYDLSLYRFQDTADGPYISIGIDAQRMGNEARFINDYRGVSHRPNALFQERRTMGGKGELRMSIWSASETIKKGEEILVSYGKSWWRAREPGVEGV